MPVRVVTSTPDRKGRATRRSNTGSKRPAVRFTVWRVLAAIPAVVAYNRFVNELGRYTGRLEAFADEFSSFLSRQLDDTLIGVGVRIQFLAPASPFGVKVNHDELVRLFRLCLRFRKGLYP